MQLVIDAKNTRLTDAIFAEAYRAVVPKLADAKHTSVRACSARLAELSHEALDISEVVELGTASDKKVRVIAVPVSVHVDDGAEVISDDSFSATVVSFEVNGIPEVQIVNLAISATEQKKLDDAVAAQKALEQTTAAQAADKELQAKLDAARKQGREEALIEKAKQEGAASVAQPATDKVQ